MSKIDFLNKSIAEADEIYLNSVLKILGQIVPDIDMESREKIAKNICWEKHDTDPDEIILMYDGRAFENPALADILTERIQRIRKKNKEIEPEIDKRYWCETCGSHSHATNPDTGYCFHCDTDNWEPENWRGVV